MGQVFFAVILVATFLLGVPNVAEARWYQPSQAVIQIKPGTDYWGSRTNISFMTNNGYNWIGYGKSNRVDQVVAFQTIIKTQCNRPVGTVDGIYGQKTYDALIWFQDNNREIRTDYLPGPQLAVDGTLGEKGWNRIAYEVWDMSFNFGKGTVK